MKILFVATRKNRDPEERELYEMDLMMRVQTGDHQAGRTAPASNISQRKR